MATDNEVTAGPKTGVRASKYYTKLIIYRSRQLALGVLVFLSVLIFTSIIFGETMLDHHWTGIAASLSFFGIPLLIFPPTQEWDYQPWQSSSEKREQIFYR